MPAPPMPPAAPPSPTSCTTPDDVYKNYACLDAFLGEDFFTRLYNYYQPGPPTDPNAPPGRIEGWPGPPRRHRRCRTPNGRWALSRPWALPGPIPSTPRLWSRSPIPPSVDGCMTTTFQLYGWVNGGSTSAPIQLSRVATVRSGTSTFPMG